MADFRKWVLVFAILALAIVPASAQVTCTATSGVTPVVRAEGMAELVGDLTLDCTGTASTQATLSNIQLLFNTPVTSKIVGSSGGLTYTEALMFIGANRDSEPGPTARVAGVGGTFSATANTYQGVLAPSQFGSAPSQGLLWLGVPIIPSGTTSRIRFTNLRVNANFVGNTLVPGAQPNIFAFISVTGSQSVVIASPQQPLAAVQSGITDATVDISSNAPLGFQQCNGVSADTASKANTVTVSVGEGFASAFKPIGGAEGLPGAPVGGQTALGVNFFTESGLLATGITGTMVGQSSIGQATQGTRIYLTVNNVPTGVHLAVPPKIGVFATGDGETATALYAVLVSNDPTAGGSVLGYAGGTITPPTAGDNGLVNVPITVGTTNTASVVYEIVRADPFGFDSLDVPFTVSFTAAPSTNSPALTVSPNLPTVTVGFAPMRPSSEAGAVSGAPIPRFVTGGINAHTVGPLFSITACVTNLLFPYVTAVPGFDTGIAIVNTSLDNAGSTTVPGAFNTKPQSGACTLYYFCSQINGAACSTAAPAPQTTTSAVQAGGMVTFSLLGGASSMGIAATPGFQGYIIARCQFQFGHGFAFVSDAGVNRIAHGYLALVIPDRPGKTSRSPDPFSAAGAGSGEQLAY